MTNQKEQVRNLEYSIANLKFELERFQYKLEEAKKPRYEIKETSKEKFLEEIKVQFLEYAPELLEDLLNKYFQNQWAFQLGEGETLKIDDGRFYISITLEDLQPIKKEELPE